VSRLDNPTKVSLAIAAFWFVVLVVLVAMAVVG
jgi:hypothetical protein